MHPAPPSQRASAEGRDWRGRKTAEEIMRVLIIEELMRLSRSELCSLAARIAAELLTYREGSPERAAAYINLRNTRFARRDLSP
jgi:hypothetical protein